MNRKITTTTKLSKQANKQTKALKPLHAKCFILFYFSPGKSKGKYFILGTWFRNKSLLKTA